MASNLKVLVDWNRDGTFTGAHDDVTLRTRGGSAASVTTEQGRNVDDPLPQVVAGRGELVLDNRDGRFTRRNTGSPLSGLVRPGRPFRLQRRVGGDRDTGGTLRSLFWGRTDDVVAAPDIEERSVTFGLVDTLADLRGRKVSVSIGLKTGIRTGDALGLLLDNVGWTAGRDLDPGVTVMPMWWEEGNDVFEAIGRLLSSEGPPAMATIAADGTFVYRDRHHRILDAASTTSQGTWRASGAEPVLARGFTAAESWSTLVNDARTSVDLWQAYPLEVVWSSDETYSLTQLVGGVTDLLITASDTFTNPQPLVAGVDYQQVSGPTLTSAAVGLAASKIGPSTFLRFINPGPTPAVISNLRLRAQPIRVARTASVSASDATSQSAYGVRTLPGGDSVGPWCGEYDAQAILDQLVRDRKNPLTQVRARFVVGRTAAGPRATSTARADAVLARGLSDRVTVKVPREFIDGDYFVESIRHELAGEEDHVVTITAEEAPTASPTGASVFRFDTTGQGFDQGVFGR